MNGKVKGHGLTVHPKVVGGSVGALLGTILLWVLSTYAGIQPPPEVATAITGVIAFIAGYLVSGAKYDPITPKHGV